MSKYTVVNWSAPKYELMTEEQLLPLMLRCNDAERRTYAAKKLYSKRSHDNGGRTKRSVEHIEHKWCRCADCRREEYAKRTEKRREAKRLADEQRRLDEMDPFA